MTNKFKIFQGICVLIFQISFHTHSALEECSGIVSRDPTQILLEQAVSASLSDLQTPSDTIKMGVLFKGLSFLKNAEKQSMEATMAAPVTSCTADRKSLIA